LLVSWNPFSNCRLPQGTTILELVICGRSVAIGLCALVPQLRAFAWRARVPVVTERNSTKLYRSMQKIVIEAPYLKFKADRREAVEIRQEDRHL
jgi:hypothetical protein